MIKENIERVKNILIKDKKARDCDNYLLSLIWAQDIANYKDDTTLTFQFLNCLARGELTNFESIRRTRQKLQAEYIELRGDRYRDRNENLEPQVKEEIRKLEKDGEIVSSFEERFGNKIEKDEGSMFQ